MKPTQFGKRLKELRTERGMSTVILGERIGVTPSCISIWERGESMPAASKINVLADYFGVSVEYLFGIGEKSNESKDNNATQKSSKKLIEKVKSEKKFEKELEVSLSHEDLNVLKIGFEANKNRAETYIEFLEAALKLDELGDFDIILKERKNHETT